MVVTILIPAALLAIVALIVAGIKTSPEKGGEEVIKNVYVYLVLFATLMMTIGGSVSIFMAVADIVSPVAYHQTFEEYKAYGIAKEPRVEGQEQETLTEQEILERYNAMVAAENERQVQRAKNNLIKSLGWVIIPLPVFVYFQKRLRVKEA